MRKSPLIQSGIVVLPLLLGLVFSAAFQQGWLGFANPEFQTRFDVAWLFAAVGIFITVILAGYFLLKAAVQRRIEQVLTVRDSENFEQNQEFLRRLDHELKNPLTIIRLGVSNLKESEELDDQQRASIGRIGEQADRLRRLVIDLRRLAELQAADLETVSVDLADVLTEAVALAEESTLEMRTVNLSLQQTPWLISTIQGDRELLILAFRNLIDNGLKYTELTNQVDIRGSDDGQHVIVEIADNGMGIPSQELPHIFENLYRGERARGVQGSGLGLPLVERIIQLHSGTIDVRSRAEKGTVFSVKLPISTRV